MLTTRQAFDKFRQRLELSDTEQKDAERRHSDVRERIRSGFHVDTDFLSGSYRRHTKTKPLKDVDVMFVLGKDEHWRRDKPPVDTLLAFEACLKKTYSADQVEIGRRSVTVEFEKTYYPEDHAGKVLSIDAVPAFTLDSGDYEICDKITGTWIKTNPATHRAQATAKNNALDRCWVPLVKMVKGWNRANGRPIKPSFLIEVMAEELVDAPFSDYPNEVRNFFAAAEATIGQSWPDPAGLGPPVSDQMTPAMVTTAKAALQEAQRKATLAPSVPRRPAARGKRCSCGARSSATTFRCPEATMTDATGRSFLSYRRSRVAEARLLIEAQHDVGIPTWQDLSDLDEGHTETLLRAAIAEKTTANAVCWLTPEVETSTVITRTELPGILRRVEDDDGFFMVPVAAGGLAYADVARVAGTYLGVHDLGQWNVRKVAADPASAEDVADIARRVPTRRARTIDRQLAPQAPLQLVLNTREKPAFEPGVAFLIDWTHRFNGRSSRTPETWHDHLLPALKAVARACAEHGRGRPVTAGGLCALPASVALGAAFLATRGIPVAWRQISPNRGPQHWSLEAAPEPCGFSYQVSEGDPSAEEIALLVSVASDVAPAFSASRPNLPAFRTVVVVHKPGQLSPHDIASAGQARDLVRIAIEALRLVRDQYQPRGALHLFLAVPAGIAMMLGQMLNTFGPVQTYEHMPTDAVGRYVPAARLQPAS